MSLLKAKDKSQRRHDLQKQAALEEASKEETTRLNAEIPVSLHNRLKIQAVKEGKGMTVTKIVIQSLEDYLSKNSDLT